MKKIILYMLLFFYFFWPAYRAFGENTEKDITINSYSNYLDPHMTSSPQYIWIPGTISVNPSIPILVKLNPTTEEYFFYDLQNPNPEIFNNGVVLYESIYHEGYVYTLGAYNNPYILYKTNEQDGTTEAFIFPQSPIRIGGFGGRMCALGDNIWITVGMNSRTGRIVRFNTITENLTVYTLNAEEFYPYGITTDGRYLYVAVSEPSRILIIDPDTFDGAGTYSYVGIKEGSVVSITYVPPYLWAAGGGQYDPHYILRARLETFISTGTYDVKWLAPAEKNPVTIKPAFGYIWIAMEQTLYTDPMTLLKISPESMEYEALMWTTGTGNEYRCTSLADHTGYLYISGYSDFANPLPFKIKKIAAPEPPLNHFSIYGTITGDVQEGVTIILAGDSSQSRTTDGTGHYSITGLSNGSYTVTPNESGYTFTPRSREVTVSGATVSEVNFVAATNSISGTVSGDVQEGVTMTLSGSISETTQITNTSGNYTFTGLSNGSYTVIPNKYLYTFSPASRKVSIADSNVTGVDFTSSRCAYSISPISQFFNFQGGTGVINVTSTSNCSWSAQSNASWITIDSGSSGTGNGTIYYSVASNLSSATTNARTGTITVGDQTFTVTQEGRTCTYSVSPLNQEYSYSGGTGYINITATSGCSWNAQSSTSWITITSGKSGTGNGTVSYSIATNSSACPRTGTITITDQLVSITQQGVSCSYSISPKEQFFSTSGGTAYITVTTESCCTWTATSNASWVTITSGSTGTGNGTVIYSVAANTGNQRTGIITIGDQTFTVPQDGTPITECSTWSEVIDKYNAYVSGQAAWNDVITCYNQCVTP